MRKILFCGVDLHSSNAMYVVTDQEDKPRFEKRLPNRMPVVLEALEPFRKRLKVVAVESTHNWYWLVDGLMDHDYPVVLANPAAIDQYDGIKQADDLTDAAFLARWARLDILPTGYIYPREDRPVRDLLRRRALLVRQRTAIILSLQNLAMRQTGQRMDWRAIRNLREDERTELLGDHDCLAWVTTEQADLIKLLTQKIKRFEAKVLEPAHLRPAYECLLTLPGVGVILALTIMLETGDLGRFETVGDYTSYCRWPWWSSWHGQAGPVQASNHEPIAHGSSLRCPECVTSSLTGVCGDGKSELTPQLAPENQARGVANPNPNSENADLIMPDLAGIVAAWPKMPERIKVAVAAVPSVLDR